MESFFGKLLFSIWLEKPAGRITLLLGVATLILLTLTAAIPVNVIGPFDARTYEPATGVYVEYSSIGAAVEPVTAFAHIIEGAPDIRVAAVSIPIWITGLVICVAAVGRLRRNRWRPDWRIVTGILKAVSSWVLVLAAYGMFILLVRIPNWRAVALDPDILLVELQTHTFGSHDGLISASDCLRYHRQRGCDVVAVTEHDKPEGSLVAVALANSDESLPSVLPGVEIKLKHIGYVVAIGPSELIARYSFTDRKGSFISSFKQNCQGVVLALTYRLTLERINHLIDFGIDGFDVASDAHPGLSPLIRKEILASADAHHLPLVAWTDWHGITGILRTWTAIRVPDSANLSRQQRAAAVLGALRRHECSNITPLVVGRMNQVSLSRAVFAPFVETIRYGLGLSLLRLLSWWVWAIVFFWVATVLLYFGIRPGRLILAVALVSMGTAIVIEGLKLIISHFSSQAPYFFPAQIGWLALAMGSVAVVFGIIGVCLAVIRR